MKGKRVSLSSLISVLLMLALSSAGGFWIGDFVSHIPDIDIRMNWWGKGVILELFLVLGYVFVYLLPVESLPASKSPDLPRSRLDFLKQIALPKQLLFIGLLGFPGVVISAVAGDILPIRALIYGLGLIFVFSAACIGLTMEDLSPTFRRARYRHLIVSFVAFFLAEIIVVMSGIASFLMRLVGEYDLIYFLVFGLVAVPYFIEVGYRAVKKDWAKKGAEEGAGESG